MREKTVLEKLSEERSLYFVFMAQYSAKVREINNKMVEAQADYEKLVRPLKIEHENILSDLFKKRSLLEARLEELRMDKQSVQKRYDDVCSVYRLGRK